MSIPKEPLRVIERCRGLAGDLQLQRRGDDYEIIYNGAFLMASYNGASEKAAIRDALQVVQRKEKPLAVLMGGLGMGYSLQEALVCPQVNRVTVAEIEPTIIKWNRNILQPLNGRALADPRAEIVAADFSTVLVEEAKKATRKGPVFDVIMVDTDNGSSWLSLPENVFLYSEEGLSLINRCLVPGGTASFWCSRREKSFEERLKKIFYWISFRCINEKTGHQGCYYLSGKP
ncbi:MAG: spermine/spermidine synthase [Bacillota bacterium]|nr:spermine/spermidine synthase [Bacillota bacterium]